MIKNKKTTLWSKSAPCQPQGISNETCLTEVICVTVPSPLRHSHTPLPWSSSCRSTESHNCRRHSASSPDLTRFCCTITQKLNCIRSHLWLPCAGLAPSLRREVTSCARRPRQTSGWLTPESDFIAQCEKQHSKIKTTKCDSEPSANASCVRFCFSKSSADCSSVGVSFFLGGETHLFSNFPLLDDRFWLINHTSTPSLSKTYI